MNKLDKVTLKQQNALAAAIAKLQAVVKTGEDNPELYTISSRVHIELETLTDTYHDLYGAK